jgi:PAS domain S-box-containing protein
MSARHEQPIRVLFIEDSSDDVALELVALCDGGVTVVHQVVETARDVRAALDNDTWDVIVSDYNMPGLDGLHALRIAREVAPDTPFILVSGMVDEDVAVGAMRAGAHDYVRKDNLTRLASVVQRELRDAETRKSGRISQNGLRLLADAGAVLGSSLDLDAILGRLPQLVVGDFGDLCVIDLVDDERGFHRAASAHADPAKHDLLRQLEQDPPPRQPASEPAELATSRQAPVVDELAETSSNGASAAFVHIAGALGLGAVLAVSLVAQDRVVGTINLARRRPYSPLERPIIEELARRIAASIENARLYQRAQRAIQLRDEFLSIASHELRTPLSALQLQIEVLRELAEKKRAEWADDRLATRLARSAQSLERLGRLVESLLDISRISTGHLALNVEAFDLVAMAREVIERIGEEARRAGCDLRVAAASPIVGSWDRLRLEQVLTNLVSNAIKYGAARPIEIELSERDGQATLEVIDHGIGVPAEDLERIFWRFERAVSTRQHGGLGLGLFITREIVEAHGGAVTARPTPSGGATFSVALPRQAAPSAPHAPDDTDEKPAPARARPAAPAQGGGLTTPAGPFAFIQEVKDYSIFMLDPEGRVLTWNDGARATKGYTAAEIVGQSYTRFYSEEDRARGKPQALLRKAISDGRVEDEGWRVRKDGSRFWADVVITAIHREDGRLRGFVKVTRDLTERRQAEELLRQSEERLRLLVESVRDYAIFMLDSEGRITTWNTGAEHIKGYRADEALGKHFSIFYRPEDLAAGRPERELQIAAAESRYEEEGWRVRKDGDHFWANVVITSIHGPAGELRGFAKITRDLTEQRRMEQEARAAMEEAARERAQALQAQQALQLRDEFISVAAHELRTPLAALHLKVEGAAQALQRIAAEPDASQVSRLAERLEGALRQIERLTELVERLLDVARIVGGKLVMMLEELDLTALVGQVVEDFREPALRAGSALRFHAAGSILGTWDSARMEQVVVNLLSNAIKYGCGNPIDVRLETTGAGVRLVVADHGIGIAAEDSDRIFTRFERAAPVQHYGGLGLGLYVTRNIVEAHGGSIQVSSGAGRGSTFVIEVPRHAVLAGSSVDCTESHP